MWCSHSHYIIVPITLNVSFFRQVWCGMHSILPKTCMTQLRPSHGVLESLVDYLPSRYSNLHLVQVAKYMKGHMGGFIESDIFGMGHSITNHPALTDHSHKIFIFLPHKL